MRVDCCLNPTLLNSLVTGFQQEVFSICFDASSDILNSEAVWSSHEKVDTFFAKNRGKR